MYKYLVLVALLHLAFSAAAQKDANGSKDHPVVSRFAGSWIRFYEFNKFNQYEQRISPVKRGNERSAQKQTLEGALTRIIYQCPKTVSPLEVHRSYEQALLKNGFEKTYACEKDNCGDGFGYSYPDDGAPHIKSYSQDQRYFAGRRKESNGTEIYVCVYTVFTQDGPVARLDVLEAKAMDGGQVTVSAAQIKSDFEKNGKAVINQIYFESGKSVLKPGADPALQEVARFLKENPALKIFVVGHTDNEGGFEFNMTLSQQRAAAVTKELNARYGIAADRIAAKGVSYLCPVASNDHETGKSKNRRVELVKQ